MFQNPQSDARLKNIYLTEWRDFTQVVIYLPPRLKTVIFMRQRFCQHFLCFSLEMFLFVNPGVYPALSQSFIFYAKIYSDSVSAEISA